MRNTSVERVMSTDPTVVSPATSVADARRYLDYTDLHHLPVVDEGRLVGMLSSSDLLKLYLLDDSESLPSALAVSSIMVRDPDTLTPRATLRDAAEILAQSGYHSLPVVDADGTLAGIITSADLARYLLRHLPRGDGSLPEDTVMQPALSATRLPDSAFAEALAALKAAPVDDPVARLTRSLLAERRLLEDVRKAAELYVRTGQAEREHGVFLKALAKARSTSPPVHL